MNFIYHITSQAAWQKALEDGIYYGDTLTTEGFIHCSTREQVAGSANRHYKGGKGLVLLHIEPRRLQAEVRFENLSGGEALFPHIYGPLNLEAVEKTEAFEAGTDGVFSY
jgi:uncharacterized protein (DUF952 family)